MTTHKIELDKEKHIYTVDDLKAVSVTTALGVISEHWNRDPYYLTRGAFIHQATAYYDRDELDESTLDPAVAPYLDAYKKFLADTDFKPRMVEFPLFHPLWRYAGTIDRVGDLNGVQVLIDLKSGSPNPADPIQLVAYWELCRVNAICAKKTFNLFLHDNGTYTLKESQNIKALWPTFQACLQIYRWREEYGNGRNQ